MIEYRYDDACRTDANAQIWPTLRKIIAARDWPDRRAFDLGCGNGATSNMLTQLGFAVMGVDPSASGISQARAAYPQIQSHQASAYDDLASRFGKFPLVVSLEVIEHCLDPRAFARTFLNLMSPDGIGILSTPYHGYFKNLALAISGRMDKHFTALWDGGHVKFFSIGTLRTLLHEAGARDIRFARVGRIPPLATSMIAVFTLGP